MRIRRELDIDFMRSFFLFFVVFIHAMAAIILWLEGHKIRIDNCKAMVNLFFAYSHPASILAGLSGYLCFRKITFTTLKSKYKKRVMSVLKTYLVWTIVFWVSAFIFANFFNWLHANNPFAHSKNITIGVSPNYLREFFFPTSPLWYLHNLVLMLMISPLLFNNNMRIALLLLTPLVYYYFGNYHTDDFNFLRQRFVFFFLLGAQLSKMPLLDFKKTYAFILGFLVIINCFILSKDIFLSELIPIFIFLLFLLAQDFLKKIIKVNYDRHIQIMYYVMHWPIIDFLARQFFSHKIVGFYNNILWQTICVQFLSILFVIISYYICKKVSQIIYTTPLKISLKKIKSIL